MSPDDAPAPERLARRLAWGIVVGGGLAFVLAAWWWVPWGWVPGVRVEAVDAGVLFTPEQVARAEEYAGVRRVLGWVATVLSLLVAGWLAFARSGQRVWRWVPGPWPVRVVLATAVVLAVGRVAVLPVSVFVRRRNLDYGLTTQSWSDWGIDVVRGYGVDLLATGLALLALVGLARAFRRLWPVLVALGAAVLVLGGSFLYPVLVEPVFNDFTTMPDGPLRSSILELADREGVGVDEVLVADASRRTTTLNAYVSGFGDTRRVVVYDTLLDGLTAEQAEVVIAHELAHALHDDVLLGTTLGALGALAASGLLGAVLLSPRVRRRARLTGPGDPAVVALVLFAVALGTLLASPVENGISRAIEARADVTSLEVTGATDAFVAMQHQLATRSLADPEPPAWSRWAFASHPTALQRIGLLEALGLAWDFDPATDGSEASAGSREE